MSSAEIAALHVKDLSDDEVIVLCFLGEYMRRFRIFPLKTLKELSGFSYKRLSKVIDLLREKELVRFFTAPYEGVMITLIGLDALALKSLATMNVIEEFGKKVGTGKESDIYDALTPEDERVCLKFYRIGRTSFRDTLRKRDYTKEDVPWFVRSVEAAKREYEVLRKLHVRGVGVPRPIAQSWHVVVMEFLDGEIVAEAKEVVNPDLVLEETLKIIKEAYRAGYVNGDLSAYNVFVTTDDRVLIIDWPQAVRRSRKGAIRMLREDVRRLCEYFNKRFGLSYDYEECFREIVS